MIDFIYNYKGNISTVPLFFSFSTVEDKEDFASVYDLFNKNKNIEESCRYLAKISLNDHLKNPKYIENLNYRKPSSVQKNI
ncbi:MULTISPECIES: hypothetical protein [unclassified Mycoplasma]|uniref:hypothetical protein n=1 Tax=unclassified Mycoplasma TaxID=2683645 RepID=UPI00197C718C|nr:MULTISPECIES: hypothetical protein [unclassified Mycoplasma]MBN4084249.1 hypothetical protein [Mycoplasma sp. CSL10166]MBU4692711.1 hypothetical protein [Mycoplasma sp. CSL7491-lung]